MHHVPRICRCGSITVLYRSGFTLRVDTSHPNTITFESASVLIHDARSSFRLVMIYRVLNGKKNVHTFTDFITEFTRVIDHVSVDQPNLLLLGDFSLHVDDASCREALFLDCLSACNLTQYITVATHMPRSHAGPCHHSLW